MAAYVIANIDVTDADAYQEYRARVGATIAAHGGRFVCRGGAVEVMEGDYDPHRVVVVEFPDMATLKRWYASPEYTPLIALRQRASKGSLYVVEGV